VIGSSGRRRLAAAGKLLLPLLAAVAIPVAAAARQPLHGFVTDRETAAPLFGVFVVLEGQAGDRVGAALSDASGRFVLTAEAGRTYRLRAERVGLGTETTDWFTFGDGVGPVTLTMAERAVELTGLNVSARMRPCRIDPAEATTVQRWWDEVRKALQATAVGEEVDLAHLRFERFERTWSANLRALQSERDLPVDSTPASPFRSPDAEALSARGFIQGREGERIFYAPDAAALFSGAFLEDHCMGIAVPGSDGDVDLGAPRAGELRLAVEPVRERPPDIRGVLTVDTLSGELRSFDFTYTNLPADLPRSRAGGHLSFTLLPSGAWVVSDWWIRMPRVRYRDGEGSRVGAVPVLVGYMDAGGRAVDAEGRPLDLDARAGGEILMGMVYDSLAGRPLAGARVSIVGARFAVRTGPDGHFTLRGVPAGAHGVTFHHATLTRLGLPSPVYAVDMAEGLEDSLTLAVPGLPATAALLCEDTGSGTTTILTGRILMEGPSMSRVRARWADTGVSGAERGMRKEGGASADGRYVLCNLPADVPVEMAVRDDSVGWRDAGRVEVAAGRITVADLRPGAEARATVRGTVRAEQGGGEPLSGALVWILAVTGDTVAGAASDSAGRFTLDVPPGVGYRAVAASDGYLREASQAFTLEGAASLDVAFELTPDPQVLAMKIEGIVVEVEARNRAAARRLLRQYGQSETTMGSRWIGVAALDSMPNTGESDPGVAIQRRGMVGVMVDQAAKRGQNPILCVKQKPRECSLIILNGMKVDLGTALLIDFRELEGIAVLSPEDATTFFGTQGGGGAVLLWMRGSGP
jgi:hypothetical protein